MSGSAEAYAQALREAADVIEAAGTDVYWVEDSLVYGTGSFNIKWHFYSRAEAEALRDRMVDAFQPDWVRTQQYGPWETIEMTVPRFPMLVLEIGFHERSEEGTINA